MLDLSREDYLSFSNAFYRVFVCSKISENNGNSVLFLTIESHGLSLGFLGNQLKP